MIASPPKIDARTAAEVAAQIQELQREHVSRWPREGTPNGAGEALIQICSRYAELIITRLNKAPEKNFLAFLDLVGVSPLPLRAARVPLTFFAVPSAVDDIVVPAGTQVAGQPSPGETGPVVYETEHELVVSTARIGSLFVKDPTADEFGDYSILLQPAKSQATQEVVELFPAFRGSQPIRHVLYAGIGVPGSCPSLKTLRLSFALDQPQSDGLDERTIQWEIVTAPLPGEEFDEDYLFLIDGLPGVAITPASDETASLTQSGDIVFEDVALPPQKNKNADVVMWVRCRLLTPVARSHKARADMVREAQLATINRLTATIEIAGADVPPNAAFFGNVKVDLSKEFYPFGEKPKFGDTFYLAAEPAFSIPDAEVTLDVTLVNPVSGGAGGVLPPVTPNGVSLRWQFWDGEEWADLGSSQYGKQIRIVRDDTAFADGTQALSESGRLRFKLPGPARPIAVNGQQSLWIRVRLVAGNYGRDVSYEREGKGYVAVPASFAAPCVKSIKVSHSLSRTAPPDALLALNDGQIVEAEEDAPLRPFAASADTEPACYLGFTLGSSTPPSSPVKSTSFSGRPLSLYVGIVNTAKDWTTENGPLNELAAVSWEYWNGSAWTKAAVQDDTLGFMRPGLIRVLTPNDFSIRREFGIKRYWLRVRRIGSLSTLDPYLRFLCLNTTIASQTQTVLAESLGSSSGEPAQSFTTLRAPVLPGQSLEIREPTMPLQREQTLVKEDEGDDAIACRTNPSTHADEIWIRWHEVPNFYGSGPRDRHYVMDHKTGRITFGDGTSGLIPPRLVGNIRMACYRTGAGASGNKAAGSIKQLRSALPYIQKVENPEAATGGADTETVPDMLARAPQEIRHRFRAVTEEDFEDLAKIASPEVSRAKCVALHDLSKDPDARHRHPGIISLIVAPRSSDPKPDLTVDLMNRVATFLDQCRAPVGQLILVAPDYVRVDVNAEVTVSSIEAATNVQREAVQALQRFLHPSTGGWDGSGWEFGHAPKHSDIHALLRNTPGLSHVRRVNLTLFGDRPGAEKTGRFLIYGGEHTIAVTTEQ
jgi:hypothetical protein